MVRQFCRNLLLALAASAMVAVSPAAMAAKNYGPSGPSGGAMLLDAVVVRPLGLCATVLGAVGWVVTLPFSALGGNVDEATKNLVVDPAKFTFSRPLGDL